jgi:hypothetical protein
VRRKGFTSIKSYYTRAKVFGYLMVLVAIAAIIYYLFPGLFKF